MTIAMKKLNVMLKLASRVQPRTNVNVLYLTNGMIKRINVIHVLLTIIKLD
jgi:hypothetical protein